MVVFYYCFQISITKIIYEKHVALKCMVKNTLNEYQLENVSIEITNPMKSFKQTKIFPIEILPAQCEEMIVI
ncbi:MAG: hypothetical protein J6B74_03835, partial [Ruminococcus sp.]|nr:hypothetical protein [Ruminococcus sp.]